MNRKSSESQITLYAFLIETPGSGVIGFQNTYVISASQQELEKEIRDQANCIDAEVVIIPPEKWHPPKLITASREELSKKSQEIYASIRRSMRANGLLKSPWSKLVDAGVIMPNPVSGRVFFIFKIEDSPIKDYLAVGEICDLCGKPRKHLKESMAYTAGLRKGKFVPKSIKKYKFDVCNVCDLGGTLLFLGSIFLIMAIVALITNNFWGTGEKIVFGGMIGILGAIFLTGRFTKGQRIAKKLNVAIENERYKWDEIRNISRKQYENLAKKR
jgi:hypothetical protein